MNVIAIPLTTDTLSEEDLLFLAAASITVVIGQNRHGDPMGYVTMTDDDHADWFHGAIA